MEGLTDIEKNEIKLRKEAQKKALNMIKIEKVKRLLLKSVN